MQAIGGLVAGSSISIPRPQDLKVASTILCPTSLPLVFHEESRVTPQESKHFLLWTRHNSHEMKIATQWLTDMRPLLKKVTITHSLVRSLQK